MNLFSETAPAQPRRRPRPVKQPVQHPGEIHVTPTGYPGRVLVSLDEGTGKYGHPCMATAEPGTEYPSGTIFRKEKVMLDSLLMAVVRVCRQGAARWGGPIL